MAPELRTEKGETVYVSPYTGQQFTSQFAYNDHVARWPQIAEENGLNLDGTAKVPGLGDFTIAQLRELATEEGIDLGIATKKAEIIAAIEAGREAFNAPPTPDNDPGAGDGGEDDGGDAPPTDDTDGESQE